MRSGRWSSPARVFGFALVLAVLATLVIAARRRASLASRQAGELARVQVQQRSAEAGDRGSREAGERNALTEREGAEVPMPASRGAEPVTRAPVRAPADLPSAPASSSRAEPTPAAPARVERRPIAAPVLPPPESVEQLLDVIAVRDADVYGYRFVEGEVRNNTNRVLENLEVTVRWYLPSGTLMATDDAVFDAPSLAAGRTAAFKVLTKSRPGMASYTLLFKSGGQPVAFFQQRGSQ